MTAVSRQQVLRFRVAQHELDRPPDSARDAALLDFGIQDTGNDGSAWALAVRGVPLGRARHLVLAWTIRGAPHAYRRADIAAIALATAPFSEADAAKRVFDAAKPLKAAGMTVLDALRTVATEMRAIAAQPTVKGAVSTALTRALEPPFLRECRPCGTTHIFEQPFRLSALQAGLELEPGTSPPVLRRIPKLRPPLFGKLGDAAEPRLHVVRNYLRFFGPATVNQVTAFLDAPTKDVKEAWPEDVEEVRVDGERRSILTADAAALTGSPATKSVRLLAPFDPYLQVRDRELLVPDEGQRKGLWRTLGRPGAVVVDGDVVAVWRPKQSGKRLSILVEPFGAAARKHASAIEQQAERLAAHRGVSLGEVSIAS